MTRESDPTRGIVDAETFGYYVIGFTSRMLESAPRKQDRFLGKLARDKFPDADTHAFLHLNGIPWEDVPRSIQQVLALQYESATIPGEKTLDIDFGDKKRIMMELNSPYVSGFSDAYGEAYVGLGVILSLTDTERSQKGQWITTKMGNRFLGKLYAISDSDTKTFLEGAEKLQEEVKASAQRRLATLEELRDLVSLFEKSTDKASVKEI